MSRGKHASPALPPHVTEHASHRFIPLYRSFGFNASRSQSPSRLIDNTMTTSAIPGKMVIHQSPENKNSWPIRISVPSDGRVGGTPTPRNDSVASVRIAVAMLIVGGAALTP